ncbi:methyltransferase domain-containing protein [Schaalia cardiffensis]|nr:methyltransferase domain-containing protein [Schaalia cardiffensis]
MDPPFPGHHECESVGHPRSKAFSVQVFSPIAPSAICTFEFSVLCSLRSTQLPLNSLQHSVLPLVLARSELSTSHSPLLPCASLTLALAHHGVLACENPPVPSSLDPLLTLEGSRLLADLEAEAFSPGDPLAAGEALRKRGIEKGLANAVLTQLDLRRRARMKFGEDAGSLFFTRDGLEQATRKIVSERRARRYLDAGAASIADLGCGIGSDSLAFAKEGLAVLAVDLDEDAASAARLNLAAHPTAQVRRANVCDLDIPSLAHSGIDALFADPARRTGAQHGSARIMDPESWSPPLSLVLSWREAIPRVGVKVAPGIAHEALPADARVEWTSVDSSLVEAAIWTGPLALEGAGRSAVVITGNDVFVLAEEGPANAARLPAPLGPLGAFIAEPDDAVIRSGLIHRLAEETSSTLVSESIAYLSADTPLVSPFLTCFEVEDVVALKPKMISSALRSLGVGRVEVKKRGADIDPAALRKSLKLKGDGEAVVFATRVAGRHRAIIARRRRA